MADIEKVIKAWEIFRSSNPYQICDGREFRAISEPEYCMGQMIADTIELLKEQDKLLRKKQKDIDKLCCDIAYLKHRFHEKTEIVRCNNCGNRFSTNCPFYMMQMETKDDFYCADGEKRT